MVSPVLVIHTSSITSDPHQYWQSLVGPGLVGLTLLRWIHISIFMITGRQLHTEFRSLHHPDYFGTLGPLETL